MLREEKTTWILLVKKLLHTEYMRNTLKHVLKEMVTSNVFPKKERILYALKATPFNKVRVVILGQDPYYRQGQATGLAFSVQKNVKIPKTLHNIFLELCSDLNCKYPTHGCLLKWAQQGVLLLNTVLTVTENKANSHCDIGWEKFTDALLKKINDEKKTKVIFVLWGKLARDKKRLIDTTKHGIIESSHPSPLSAHISFFGSKCFSRVNRLLQESNQTEISWEI